MARVSARFPFKDELYQVELDAGAQVLAEAQSTVTGDRYPSVWIPPHPAARIISIALGLGREAHEQADFGRLLSNAVDCAATIR